MYPSLTFPKQAILPSPAKTDTFPALALALTSSSLKVRPQILRLGDTASALIALEVSRGLGSKRRQAGRPGL